MIDEAPRQAASRRATTHVHTIVHIPKALMSHFFPPHSREIQSMNIIQYTINSSLAMSVFLQTVKFRGRICSCFSFVLNTLVCLHIHTYTAMCGLNGITKLCLKQWLDSTGIFLVYALCWGMWKEKKNKICSATGWSHMNKTTP